MFRFLMVPAVLLVALFAFATDANAQCRRASFGAGAGYAPPVNFGAGNFGNAGSCYDDEVVEIRQFRLAAVANPYAGNFGGGFGSGGYAYGGNQFRQFNQFRGNNFGNGFGGGGGFRGGFGNGGGGGGGGFIANTIRAIGDVANSPAGSFALGAFTGAGGFGRR